MPWRLAAGSSGDQVRGPTAPGLSPGIRALLPHVAGLIIGVTVLLLAPTTWQPPAALDGLGRLTRTLRGSQQATTPLKPPFGLSKGAAAPPYPLPPPPSPVRAESSRAPSRRHLPPSPQPPAAVRPTQLQPPTATASAAAAGAALGSCRLDVSAAPIWTSSCQLLTNVCVDQQTIILYGKEYAPRGHRAAKLLPHLQPTGKQSDSYSWHYRSGRNRGRSPLPPIKLRPASDAEGPGYLRDPPFSTCTVPIIHSPFWLQNFGHTFRDNAAVLYGALRRTPWWPHAKLVVLTPDGLGMQPFDYELYQSLSNHTVETWADFSSRLGPAAAAAPPVRPAWPGGPALPASYEGPDQRCFSHMFVCTSGLSLPLLPAYSYGQHVVRYYRDHGWRLQPPAELAQLPADKAAAATAGERVLRVVFQKRAPGHPGRAVLNLQELLQRCNAWRFKLGTGTGGGARWTRAHCVEVEFADLQSGMAAAQAADIVVGMHGANQANGWLMRPGGAIIELQAFEFERVPEHLQHPERNMMDPATRVQWYVIMACDPEASLPGSNELAGRGRRVDWVKARSMRVRWDALEAALRTAASTAGDMAAYRRLWQQGRWWWHMLPGEQLRHGGPDRSATCPGMRL